MKRRRFILLVGGASSGAMSVGTGAFSSAEVERGVSIGVEDDEDAYVGYRTEKRVLPEDEENGKFDIVTVENRFSKKVTIEVTDVDVTVGPGSESGPTITDLEYGTELGPGDSETIRGALDPDEIGEWVVAATVTVAGTEGDVRARIFGDSETQTRAFTVEREPSEEPIEVTGASYDGNGQVTIHGSRDGKLEMEFYVRENEQPKKALPVNTETHTVPVNEKIGNDLFSNQRIVAVGEVGDETVYLHPGWNQDECAFDNSGTADPGIPSEADPAACN